jgi:hypothetical protein
VCVLFSMPKRIENGSNIDKKVYSITSKTV